VAVEPGAILEAVEHRHAETVAIERQQRVEIVGQASDS
jgi:hypothetical protein